MAQPAFLSSLRSRLRSAAPVSPHPLLQPSRGYHVDLGAREKALLEEDVALKRFKSYKNSVKQVSKIGNVLTLAVAIGPIYTALIGASLAIATLACTYEIAVLATSSK